MILFYAIIKQNVNTILLCILLYIFFGTGHLKKKFKSLKLFFFYKLKIIEIK